MKSYIHHGDGAFYMNIFWVGQNVHWVVMGCYGKTRNKFLANPIHCALIWPGLFVCLSVYLFERVYTVFFPKLIVDVYFLKPFSKYSKAEARENLYILSA